MHILRLPFNYTPHFLFLRFGNVQSMHDLFALFDIHVLLQFLHDVIFTTKFKALIRLLVLRNFVKFDIY